MKYIKEENSVTTQGWCKDGYLVTEKMRMAGFGIISDMMDAEAAYVKATLDNNLLIWEHYKETYTGDNLDLLRLFVTGKMDSVTVTYLAMDRAKEPNSEAKIIIPNLIDNSDAYKALLNAYIRILQGSKTLEIFTKDGSYLETNINNLLGDLAPFSD